MLTRNHIAHLNVAVHSRIRCAIKNGQLYTLIYIHTVLHARKPGDWSFPFQSS